MRFCRIPLFIPLRILCGAMCIAGLTAWARASRWALRFFDELILPRISEVVFDGGKFLYDHWWEAAGIGAIVLLLARKPLIKESKCVDFVFLLLATATLFLLIATMFAYSLPFYPFPSDRI